MRAINLVFGTSNCVATGTPEARIEALYQRAFKPFLQTLYEFPEVALTMHYSGVLLEWLHVHHPEFIMLINEMVKRKQIELLGGSYYQTILPLIPSNDRTAQVELLTTLLRRRFGKRPRGAWVTELVWEPGMASSLKRSGMDYIFLTDNHFIGAGLRNRDLLKPVLTEDQGKTLFVFPISSEFSVLPFSADPKKIVDQIVSLGNESDERIVSIMNDGECFGEWDNSYKLLFEDGWLEEFLHAICDSKGSLVSTHPGRYLKNEIEYKKCYFPCTSYEEMTAWALTPERKREFEKIKSGRLSKSNRAYLRGGFFRQFLSKYPESNLMYAKLMHTYDLVNQVRGDRYRKKAAREELWRGEDHSAYWHGKRSGVYMHLSRKAVYSALIAAEKTARQRGIFKSHISTIDFDLDGFPEYLYNGAELNMYVHRKGGMVYELDYLAKPWNYLDTFTRKPEQYSELSNNGHTVDQYPRRAFVDHFFALGARTGKHGGNTYREHGTFLTIPYEVKECKKDSLELTFSAAGAVTTEEGERSVSIEKQYKMKRATIFVDYLVTNNGPGTLAACFCPELNLSFHDMSQKSISLSIQCEKEDKPVPDTTAHEKGATGFTANDKKNGVTLSFAVESACNLHVFPLEAEWLDREGKHREYQSTCFLPIWELAIPEKKTWSVSIQLSFSKTG